MNPNPYAARAEKHWQQFLPAEYEKIPAGRRAAFFARLGHRIEDRVTARTETLLRQQETREGSTPADPPRFIDNLAAMLSAKTEAERQVLAEMLPVPPDPEDTAR